MEDTVSEAVGQPSYDELLREFKLALNRALSGSIMPRTAIPDGPLTLALLDIAYAARNGQPTNYLVSRACFQFSRVAAASEGGAPSATAPLKAVS
ncbi:hypothetical protein [Mycobacterium paraterrae]|uniref:Uncharacterized protein n=1 Tax=Mycobacterium paraterrae TaxID=577492 RepID=A0ABY3VLY1_9MYCO|nr:hypothetical protein [Mycobacterium paraterrae]UMB68161.1 hypothetical protein MKK62_17125 [Mycobacterium paraterrae]